MSTQDSNEGQESAPEPEQPVDSEIVLLIEKQMIASGDGCDLKAKHVNMQLQFLLLIQCLLSGLYTALTAVFCKWAQVYWQAADASEAQSDYVTEDSRLFIFLILAMMALSLRSQTRASSLFSALKVVPCNNSMCTVAQIVCGGIVDREFATYSLQ